MPTLHVSLVVLLYAYGKEGQIEDPCIVLWKKNSAKEAGKSAGLWLNSLPHGRQYASFDKCLQSHYPSAPTDRLRALIREHLGDRLAEMMTGRLMNGSWDMSTLDSHKDSILKKCGETHFLLMPYSDTDAWRINPTRISIDYASEEDIQRLSRKTARETRKNAVLATDPKKALEGTIFANAKSVKVTHICLSDDCMDEVDLTLAHRAFGMVKNVFAKNAAERYRRQLRRNRPMLIGQRRTAEAIASA